MKTLASCAVVAVLVVGAPAAWGQASWRGLVVAAANRCAPYDSDEYGYSQNLELAAIASMGGADLRTLLGPEVRSANGNGYRAYCGAIQSAR